ncbi:hypothetical protein ACT453_60165, partial [Bacillus sp. D-CC]
FGMIADDTDGIFTDKEKRAINLYNTVSILIAAFQQLYDAFISLKEQVKQNTEELHVVSEIVLFDSQTHDFIKSRER